MLEFGLLPLLVLQQKINMNYLKCSTDDNTNGKTKSTDIDMY